MKSVKGQKIYDGHIHCHLKMPWDKGLEVFNKRMEDTSLAGGAFLSFPRGENPDDDCMIDNIACLYYKETLGNPYTAFADFMHYPDDPDYFLDFAKKCVAMGFDGFKSLLQLPSVRKRIGVGINDPRFEKFFAYIEEEGIPYVAHVGNPAMYWDKSRLPERIIKLGRYFDETFLTLEELYQEAFDVLKRHPKLRITFAHGLFMGDNHDRLREIMDTYENVTIDLTPNAHLFVDMSEDLELWKKFFEDYQTRILFGSDTYVPHDTMKTVLADDVIGFLETPGPVPLHDGTTSKGIDIDGEMLQNICWNNGFRRATPKPLNYPMIVEECQRILKEEELKDWEIDNLNLAIKEFSK